MHIDVLPILLHYKVGLTKEQYFSILKNTVNLKM